MIYENDKLIIPEKYKKMSVSELRSEKERIYMEINKTKKSYIKKQDQKEPIVFHF